MPNSVQVESIKGEEQTLLRKRTLVRRYWRLALIALTVVLTVLIIAARDVLSALPHYGYPGIFLVSLLGNATIFFPAPSLAFVFAMGSALNPVVVGLVAGLGEALGEITGYLAGYGGRMVIENRELYGRLEAGMKRYGLWVILALSIFPNPTFDLAGIAAGALRFPFWSFLLTCWVGKTIKTVTVALIGAGSISFFLRLWPW